MIGAATVTELSDWLPELELDEEELELEDELEADPLEVVEAVTMGALVIVVTLVVVVVVLDPATHFPFNKMSPNLLGQVLQPTPPSL